MNFLDSMLTYLQDNEIGTLAIDLFSGDLPIDIDECVSGMTTESPAPERRIAYYTQNIDFWSRNKDNNEAYDKLQAIFTLLHGKEHYEIEGYHVYLSYANGMIRDLDRDVQRRHLKMLSMGFIYRST